MKAQEKLCKSDFISRPSRQCRAFERQAATCICSCFSTVPWQWCSWHSRVASILAAASLSIQLWWDRLSHCSGFEVTAPPALCCTRCNLRPSLRIWDRCTACTVGLRLLSKLCEITWFETACANNWKLPRPVQTIKVRHFYCNPFWWMFMQRHATSLLIPQQTRSRTLLVTHLIISCNSCCWGKIYYPTWRGVLGDNLLHSVAINQNL